MLIINNQIKMLQLRCNRLYVQYCVENCVIAKYNNYIAKSNRSLFYSSGEVEKTAIDIVAYTVRESVAMQLLMNEEQLVDKIYDYYNNSI